MNAHIEFHQDWRLLSFVGLKKGEDFPYQQLYAGLGLGYQWKKITKPHVENIDPDKERTFVFGGGYERLQTVNSEKTSYENRLGVTGCGGISAGFAAADIRSQPGGVSMGERSAFDAIAESATGRV